MTITYNHISLIIKGTLLTILPLTAQAEIVGVAGKAEAFFPQGEYYTVQDEDNIIHVAHANRQDKTFYDLYLVQDHGDDPTEQWFLNFIEGQRFSVSSGEIHIMETSHQDESFHGTFALSGKYKQMPYKKICRLIINKVDYATWCVSVLSENADILKAWRDFLNHGDKFILLD